MGYKNVCINCKVAFNSASGRYAKTEHLTCPNCGEVMIWMPHRFRPPRKIDTEAWATVKYLVENGFKYHHIYEQIPKHPNGATRLVSYPTTLREAKKFVEKYKIT